MAYMTNNKVDDDHEVFRKAIAREQHTFTLVSQDLSSPRTIAFWILENIETAPPQKLLDALEDAIKMREWPERKHAD